MLLLQLEGVTSWVAGRGITRRSSWPWLASVADAEVVTPEVGGLKVEIMKLGLLTGRGAWAREPERARAAALVADLEQAAKAQEERSVLRDGVWELILSDVEPFRASVFFLALAEAVEKNIQSGASDGALTVHSLATGGGEVGRVAHVIENGGSKLHSLVELKSGSLPSLPLVLTGTVISSGSLSPHTEDDSSSSSGHAPFTSFTLSLENTTVQESTVVYGLPQEGGLKPGAQRGLLDFIGDQRVPSGNIFGAVLDPLGGGQEALLQLTFADDDLMVWRTPRLADHFFVLVRGEESSWAAMDELRAREESETRAVSPLGSAFALGMLNPFFTRRVNRAAGAASHDPGMALSWC